MNRNSTKCSIFKYIRKRMAPWLFGLFVPALAQMATNVYFADKVRGFSAILQSGKATLGGIAAILGLALPVLLFLSCMDDVGRHLFDRLAVSVENELRQDLYGSLLRTPMGKLEQYHQGELLARYGTDSERSSYMISYDLYGVVYLLVAGGGYLAAVFFTDFAIGLFLLFLGVGGVTLNLLYLRKMKEVQKETLQAGERYNMDCKDAVSGKMTLRQYGAGERMAEKIAFSAEQLKRKEYKKTWVQALKLLTSDSVANACTYLVTPFSCVLAAYGYLPVPAVLFIHQICRNFMAHAQTFAVTYLNRKSHEVNWNRLCPILCLPGEGEARTHNVLRGNEDIWADGLGYAGKRRKLCVEKNEGSAFPANGELCFRQVSVSYGERRILDEVSFTARPGEIVALTGESGSGKSTLVKALLQLVDYQGQITVGGQDCARLSLDFLRDHVSYVPEHGELFPVTVAENIRYGKMQASSREIIGVMGRAAIAKGEEFGKRQAGENGELLSGGQRQKVALARALLKNAPILILDEPTAALDVGAETQVLETFQRLKQEGKILLLITHKASTLRIADQILHL